MDVIRESRSTKAPSNIGKFSMNISTEKAVLATICFSAAFIALNELSMVA